MSATLPIHNLNLAAVFDLMLTVSLPEPAMTLRRILFSALVCAAATHASAWAHDAATAQDLSKEAKVSKDAAQKTALDAVPGGVVASSELEREHGKLVWSFDIKRAGSKDITEIQVGAVSGVIVSKEIENAQAQAKEAAADRKHPPH